MDLNIFPLQTLQSLAERWNVQKQLVYKWSKTHLDFPKPIKGLIASTEKTPVPTVFALNDIERYEKLRGGAHRIADINKGKAGRPAKGARS